jgi:hypothetical protein
LLPTAKRASSHSGTAKPRTNADTPSAKLVHGFGRVFASDGNAGCGETVCTWINLLLGTPNTFWNRLFASLYDLLAARWTKKRMFKYQIAERIN